MVAEKPAGHSREYMFVAAARRLLRHTTIFVGVGEPAVPCAMAHKLRPETLLVYESGIIGAQPIRTYSIGDSRLVDGASALCSLLDLFALMLQGGKIDVAVTGAAQVDRYGNLNTTCIGDYARPQVRLPGSGGAADIAAFAQSTLILASHERRRFPPEVDFITSPGHRIHGRTRIELGLPGAGPAAIVTDLGIFEFSAAGEAVLTQVHPDVMPEMVAEQTGWNLLVADDLTITPPPSERELRALAEVVA
ncbi:MAG: hypothetical protein M5U01_14450 [Ardenticatenaceae bacterium]|nr:hypothetical protein [Ardenticatenaceae bacterium]HBY95147.1 3-oxoadipate--succinyl-CoA transferase subunit B [Chloroflexota bacterium]